MRIATGLVLLVCALGAVRPSRADIIHLVNGGRVRGTVIDRSGGLIRVRTAGGIVTLKASEVLRIETETGAEQAISEASQYASAGRLQEALDALAKAEQEGASAESTQRLRIQFMKTHAGRLEAEGRLAEAHSLLGTARGLAPEDASVQAAVERLEKLLVSVTGTVEEARRALASGDPVRAVQLYERALRESPPAREGLSEEIGRAYYKAGLYLERRNDPGALEMLKKALKCCPRHEEQITRAMVLVRYSAVRRLSLDKKTDEAIEESERLVRDAPNVQFVKLQHATLLLEKRRLSAARAELVAIVPEEERKGRSFAGRSGLLDLARLARKRCDEEYREYTGRVDKERDERARVQESGEQKLSGRYFAVIHRNESLARQVLKVAERHAEKVMTEIGLGGQAPWEGTCTILLAPDRETYLRRSGMPEWSVGASHTELLGKGVALRSISLYQTGPRLLESTVPHEVNHVIFSALIDHDRRVPVAIHEGVAVSLEPGYSRRTDAPALLWQRLTGGLIPLRELLVAKRIGMEFKVFYPQSASLVSFLVGEKGWKTFLEFVKTLASDGATRAAGAHYGFEDLEALEKAWLDSIGR